MSKLSENVVYMRNERSWTLFVLLGRRRRFHIRFSIFFLLFALLFQILCYCSFRNRDAGQISVSKPNTSLSNQHSSNNPFKIQTPWNFHRKRVKLKDKFLVRGTTRQCQLLGPSLQNFQKLQTLGWDCSGYGIFSSYCFLKKLYFLRPRQSAKYNIWRQFAIIIQCSPCFLLGCVFIMPKVSLSRVGT